MCRSPVNHMQRGCPRRASKKYRANVLEGRPAAGTPAAACTISPTNHEREVGVHKQRAFLLFAIFAAAAATPARGQTSVAAAGAAASGTQGAASIPDFSGMWGNPFLTGLGAAALGPGPGDQPVAPQWRERHL